MARNKEASVAELICFSLDSYHWNISFTRLGQDWELESIASFMDLLYSGVWKGDGVDKLCWKLSSVGVYDVRSYYKVLQPPSHMSFPWKTVWKPNLPTKISFFIWTAALGLILTNDNLQKRWLLVINWCCICKRAGETTNHLLLCCPVARELWCMVFTLFGVHLVMLNGVMELLSSWPGKFSKHRNGVVWNIIPHCLMCGIWRERNAQIFEGTESSTQDLKLAFFHALLGWTTASGVSTFCL